MDMKTYIISRTSNYGDDEKPCDEAYPGQRPGWDLRTFKSPEEHDNKMRGSARFKPWHEEGTEHGTWSGGICRRLADKNIWLIDAESIDELVERYGQLVIDYRYGSHLDRPEMRVEIYDGYRE